MGPPPFRTPPVSPSPTLVDIQPLSAKPTEVDPLHAIFEINELLSQNESNLPFTNIVSVGQQSAGKSSVLSAVCNIPLYSNKGTATHGPTQIHSRRTPDGPFTADVFVEFASPAPGLAKRVPFTTKSLTTPQQLAEVLRLAGDEARRAGDGSNCVRPFETLQKMPLNEVQAGREHWPMFTANVVVLKVSGPAQPNLSIIDLPGICSDPLPALLADHYLSRDENLIVFCIEGATTDPPADGMTIPRKYDPKGVRTFGIITKADRMDDPGLDDEWIRIVTGHDEAAAWKIDHKWWPTVFRTQQDVRNNVSDFAIEARQRQLFASREWTAIAKAAGRELGVAAMKAKLGLVFKDMVVANITRVQSALRAQQAETEAHLSLLPPVETMPVTALHAIVDRLTIALQREVAGTGVTSETLVDLQFAFAQKSADAVPVFKPYLKADKDKCGDFAPSASTSLDLVASLAVLHADQRRAVYIDELRDSMLAATNKRTGDVDIQETRTLFSVSTSEVWREVCAAHIEAAWQSVTDAVAMIVQGICGDKQSLCSELNRLLAKQQQSYREAIEDLADRLCRRERIDAVMLDVYHSAYKHDIEKQKKRLSGYYVKTYPNKPGDTLSNGMTVQELDTCLTLMSTLVVNLVRGASRIRDVIGREVQGQIMEYLDGVPAVLRQGLRLSEVQTHVDKRAARLHEPSAEMVSERNAVLKRKRELDDVGQRLEDLSAVEDW